MFSRQATKEAISKVRMLTDTMMNGEKESKMFNRSPQCQCSHPMENRFHLILDCPVYQDNREHCISRMITLINGNHPEITEIQIRDRTALCYLILDPSWFRSDIGSPGFSVPNILSIQEANLLEHYGRKFCFQIYKRRTEILLNEDTNYESETEDEDIYSLHDTTDSVSLTDTSDYEDY